MCGIAGILGGGGQELDQTIELMTATLHHRGPDDGGRWRDPEAGVALGHRRLSILDLSPLGRQPMLSRSGRFVITFNGEIYNFTELRQSLTERGHTFLGTSDTEVMLAGFEEWGVEATLPRLVGMFAFGVWDSRERRLTLARDRMGEKPLFYGWCGRSFAFASELKALRTVPGFPAELNRDAIAMQLRLSYIPTPWSIVRGVYKLTPGSFFHVSPGQREEDFSPHPDAEARLCPRRYWDLTRIIRERTMFNGTDTEAVTHLESLLRTSIRGQMVADVPLGAFLSGGVDSSTVVALMQTQSSRPIRTFAIGFHEAGYNEAVHAAAVARHLGTDHTELYVSPAEAREVIPLLPTLYDEPFSDSSQIPTLLVAKLARQHVTVSLSGDGGDELFGGYTRYLWGETLWKRMRWIPRPLRAAIGGTGRLLPHRCWAVLGALITPLLPPNLRIRDVGGRALRATQVVGTTSQADLYYRLLSHCAEATSLVRGSEELTAHLREPHRWPDLPFRELMMYVDALNYLPDDILVKVDRATMGVSLESRVPLLDHRVVEFAWGLPLNFKIRERTTKWILRQVLYRYVPATLIERPKMGFGIPVGEWLRGPLREWGEELLDARLLAAEGIFDPAGVRRIWREHQSGAANREYLLWDILVFQSWLRHWQRGTPLVLDTLARGAPAAPVALGRTHLHLD